MKKINSFVITICATKNYCYAIKSLARRIHACTKVCTGYDLGAINVVIAGDNSSECKNGVAYWKTLFDNVTHLNVLVEDETAKNYKTTAQLTIAKLRQAAFTEARRLNADYCWSLDSDTLPPANALRCMLGTLDFDDGYYNVSSCPYPNMEFLGGFGTYQNQIAEDFLPHERKLSKRLKFLWETNEKQLREWKERTRPDKLIKRRDRLHKRIKECPPDGTIWEVISKHGWRRRGWFNSAYSGGIGLGTMCVPVDWTGFGCLLMDKHALSYSVFDGYEGAGTEDLYVMWNYWHPNKIRMNTVPHCLCDHVIASRKKNSEKPNKFDHVISFHEREGECRGHPRTRIVPWLGD